jgi:hypothetical protein
MRVRFQIFNIVGITGYRQPCFFLPILRFILKKNANSDNNEKLKLHYAILLTIRKYVLFFPFSFFLAVNSDRHLSIRFNSGKRQSHSTLVFKDFNSHEM